MRQRGMQKKDKREVKGRRREKTEEEGTKKRGREKWRRNEKGGEEGDKEEGEE